MCCLFRARLAHGESRGGGINGRFLQGEKRNTVSAPAAPGPAPGEGDTLDTRATGAKDTRADGAGAPPRGTGDPTPRERGLHPGERDRTRGKGATPENGTPTLGYGAPTLGSEHTPRGPRRPPQARDAGKRQAPPEGPAAPIGRKATRESPRAPTTPQRPSRSRPRHVPPGPRRGRRRRGAGRRAGAAPEGGAWTRPPRPPPPPGLGAAPYRPQGPPRRPQPTASRSAPARGRRRRGCSLPAGSSGRGNLAAERTATGGGRGPWRLRGPQSCGNCQLPSPRPEGQRPRRPRGRTEVRGSGLRRCAPSNPRPARDWFPSRQLGERPSGRSPLGFPSGSDPLLIQKPIPPLWAPEL
ncbi:basic salivary proline-rich protein 1-like [Camelus dromedarius]|uniref:basic salivary proline-rich protein 1-like n=1 Tax=Camelus dromedarius TaxID=9838 RepID=UPI0031195C1B